MLHSYHTAFYICGATTTLSACLMFLIPWLVPNQQGGVFRRDSAQSRLESLLSSRSSTPRISQRSRRFFADSSFKSGSSSGSRGSEEDRAGNSSLCEADRMELDYLNSFTPSKEGHETEDGEKTPLSKSNSLSMDTSLNTVFNSTMSHRGSITKFLLQQQLQSQNSRSSSPLSDSCRVLGHSGSHSRGDSSRSSMSSYFGSSRRTSFSSPSKSKDSRGGSNSILGEDLSESNSQETSDLNSSEVEPEVEESSTEQLPEVESRRDSGESTVVGSCFESGQSTVVGSHYSSVIRVAGSRKISQVSNTALCKTVKDTDMLHVLAARLLQAARERDVGTDDKRFKESVV